TRSIAPAKHPPCHRCCPNSPSPHPPPAQTALPPENSIAPGHTASSPDDAPPPASPPSRNSPSGPVAAQSSRSNSPDNSTPHSPSPASRPGCPATLSASPSAHKNSDRRALISPENSAPAGHTRKSKTIYPEPSRRLHCLQTAAADHEASPRHSQPPRQHSWS